MVPTYKPAAAFSMMRYPVRPVFSFLLLSLLLLLSLASLSFLITSSRFSLLSAFLPPVYRRSLPPFTSQSYLMLRRTELLYCG